MEKENEWARLAASGYWLERRTVRRFANSDVAPELIYNAVLKASKAPTTGGMQLYSVVETRNAELLEKLAAQHFNQPAATGARVMLTVLADFNRFEKWCLQRGASPGFRNFQSFTAAFLDATIFAQQLTTLLETEGLGVCYLGTTTYNADEIGEILHLPRLTVPVAALAVGYPEGEAVEAERLDADAVLHREIYHDYTPDGIEAIYAAKEALEANRRFVEQNAAPSLAHVFTDVRYPRSNAELFSKKFYDYIERQGFSFPK